MIAMMNETRLMRVVMIKETELLSKVMMKETKLMRVVMMEETKLRILNSDDEGYKIYEDINYDEGDS